MPKEVEVCSFFLKSLGDETMLVWSPALFSKHVESQWSKSLNFCMSHFYTFLSTITKCGHFSLRRLSCDFSVLAWMRRCNLWGRYKKHSTWTTSSISSMWNFEIMKNMCIYVYIYICIQYIHQLFFLQVENAARTSRPAPIATRAQIIHDLCLL